MNGSSFARMVEHLGEIVRHPHLYPVEVLILVCLVVIAIFIAIISYVLLQMRFSKGRVEIKRPRINSIEELSRAVKWRYAAIAVLLSLSIGSIASAFYFDSSPNFCTGCHEMRRAFDRSLKSAHGKVGCVSCHQEPGTAGIFVQKLEYVEMMAERYKIIGKVSSVSITNQVCLRCHSSINDRTLVSGAIRVEHVHPQDAGYKCTDCHFEKGLFHTDISGLEKSKMSRCMNCHDGAKAPTACKTCHVRKDIGTAHVDLSEYAKAEVSESAACKTCHAIKKCLGCHEIQLPHQEAWVDGGHAYNSFVSRALCFECHVEKNCLKCHEKLNVHGKDWRKKHGAESKKTGDNCAQCHQYERFCMLCHDE
jgi:nitrate/TMAO reductase-like tetraheme cytochrome c subunit